MGRRVVRPALRASSAAAASVLLSCTGARFEPGPFVPVPQPAPDDVAGVVFLVGDAGAAVRSASPLVHGLREDVEAWSSVLAADSAVTVLFLGDNVYPSGVHASTHDDFPRDTARLGAQVWSVSGPAARRRGTRGIFLAGNHDWGNLRGSAGLRRLRNQGDLLDQAAAAGAPVALRPAPGEAGPDVVDLPFARLVLLDTHWWIQGGSDAAKDSVAAAVRNALGGAGARPVVVAAHHPFVSAGPHSGLLQTRFDPLWPLRRAGAMVQDLNSGPFRELRARLADAFVATAPPLVFAAGHDHSLQVLEGLDPGDPTWTLVSGAGSKVTSVARAEGLVWAADTPGYMRLVFRRNGAVDLFVVGLPERYLVCEGPARARCVSDGVAAARTTYSTALRAPR